MDDDVAHDSDLPTDTNIDNLLRCIMFKGKHFDVIGGGEGCE